MNGFWDFLIRPALEAAEAQVVVEVGSEGGRHTRRLLDWCSTRRARLHVVEPEPQYDVAELEACHGQRLVFHSAPSLEVLDRLGRVDAVLIDGDHNWFTVYHELKMLEATQRSHFPLVVLHDVAWPFARRDMYYDPARIPAPYRHPYAQGGLRRGAGAFIERDGLAPELYKAIQEGGPRNGVLTAVEDFLQESELALRFELVSVDFGLGLIAGELLQENRPALRSLLDSLHSAEFGGRLVAYAEERRIEDLIGLQGENRQTRAELVRVTAELGLHQAELARHEVEVKRLRNELAALQQELHAERQAGESLRHDHSVARDALAQILDSRSWRLTAPLRRAGNVVRSWERT
ncbi:MAG TPA: class I SAM-dependent methyltransferase [Myxococcota bacterium]|nr:class I SAM-dependent methyltransferase [Myxococcota bacterium]